MRSDPSARELLTGEIIDASRAMGLMREALTALQDAEILVISAYLTVNGLRELLADVSPTNRVRILARWQPSDLLCGASDLASFDLAQGRGWRFYTSQALHAKAFALGEEAIYIGSANLTRRGFSLGADNGNIEILTRIPSTARNIGFLERMFTYAVEIDQVLAEHVREWLDANASRLGTGTSDGVPVWPLLEKERALQRRDVDNLTVSECFLTDGGWIPAVLAGHAPTAEQAHDVSMLTQVELANRGAVAGAIRQTKVFCWLEQQLCEAEGKELYFGALTASLHNALIDDPRPYRRDVKTLLAFLLAWLKAYPECGIHVDRPNYSELVRLA